MAMTQPRMRLFTCGLVLLFSAWCTFAQQPRQHGEVWIGGRDPLYVNHPGGTQYASSNFLAMFEPGAPWERTAAATKVMQLPPSLIYHASKEQLHAIIVDLDRRHIALGVAFGWLHGPGPNTCGQSIEGFAAPGSAGLMARILKAAGGNLQYVAMDEPYTFGHNYSGPRSCHYTIEQTATVVAEGAAQVRAVFPDVKIGDVEPVGSKDPTWPAQLKEWMAAYQRAAGRPLAFFHADIQWKESWMQQIPPVKAAAHQAHMPFGIIYDGVGQSDQAWVSGAEQRFRQIEANPQWRPDNAIFQSWELYPTQMLPEGKPGTETNLALRYLQNFGER